MALVLIGTHGLTRTTVSVQAMKTAMMTMAEMMKRKTRRMRRVAQMTRSTRDRKVVTFQSLFSSYNPIY